MKLKAIIKEDKPKISKDDKIFGAILFTSEMVINTIIPFFIGIILYSSKNLLWIIPLILIVVIKIKIEYSNNKFIIKILRRI